MRRLWHFVRSGWTLTLITALLSWPFGQQAFAAAPDSLKDLLSDARPSTAAMHTITINLASGTQLADGETMTVTFPSGFTVPSFVAADATFSDKGTTKTLQDAACGSTNTISITVSGQVVTFTACNSYTEIGGDGDTVIELGTGATKATNHATPGSYQMTVAGTYGDDSKDAAIAIIGGVTMSATIDESISHTTAGVTTGNCPDADNGSPDTEIDTSGDAATVPFGTISANTFYAACQQLTVSTNAGSGYATTVKTTTRPTSGANTISEGTCDGGCSDTTEADWATNTNNGYGYCMENQTSTPATTADAGWGTNGCDDADTFWKTINRADASELGQNIMASATSVSGDSAYIKYRISRSGTQAAGAYTTTIVYVSTGTF